MKVKSRNISLVKLIIPLTALLIFTFLAPVVLAEELVEGDFVYEIVNGNEARILDFNDEDATEIIIPEKLGGYNVTTIGTSAFSSLEYLNSIQFPSNLKVIENYAFDLNPHLREVDFPEGLEHIGDGAFYRNYRLHTVNLPQSLKTIGTSAFRNCDIAQIEIPKDILEIGNSAFMNNDIWDLLLPEGMAIKEIPRDAFRDNRLKSVVIPEGIEGISNGAFMSNRLEEVTFPSTLKIIGTNAFATSEIAEFPFLENRLEALILPERLESIGSGAFVRNEINEVNFPDSLIEISGLAFGYNELTDLSLPNNLEVIGPRAFVKNNLSNIESNINIPNTVEEIGGGAFAGNGLEENDITLGAGFDDYFIFSEDSNNNNEKTQLEGHISGGDKGVLNIPEGTSSIASWSFRGNYLTEVTMPATVKRINQAAFSNNPYIEHISIPDSVEFISSHILTIMGEIMIVHANSEAYDWGIENERNIQIVGRKVSFDMKGADSEQLEDMYVELGEPVRKPEEPAKDGYVFLGWEKNEELFDFKNIKEDITVKAIWEPIAYEDFVYELIDGEIHILGYDEQGDKDVVIPDEIHGAPVTLISDDAFLFMEIESVQIPSTVRIIEGSGDPNTGAFAHNYIKEVVLPEELEYLGVLAFAGNELTKVEIPKGVRKIQARTFQGNELEEVIFNEGLEKIEGRAFWGNYLEEIKLPEGFKTIDGVAFEDNNIKRIFAPSSVEEIAVNAFSNNQDFNVYITIFADLDSYAHQFAMENGYSFLVEPLQKASLTIEYKDTNDNRIGETKNYQDIKGHFNVEAKNIDGYILKRESNLIEKFFINGDNKEHTFRYEPADEADLEVGDYIEFGSYYGEPILWQVINLDAKGDPLLFSDKILTLKAFDAAGEYHSGNDRDDRGSNFYRDSNIRQWLNSTENKINWIQNPPKADNLWEGHNPYDTESGFLSSDNFTEEERSLINLRSHRTLLSQSEANLNHGGIELHDYESDVNEDVILNYDNSFHKVLKDKVFLLSIKEVMEYVYDNEDLNFEAFPTEKAVDNSTYKSPTLMPTNYWSYWFRTPRVGIATFFGGNREAEARRLHEWGHSIDNRGAHQGQVGVRPAISLNTSLGLIESGDGSSEKPYIFILKEDDPEDPAPTWSNLTPATARALDLDSGNLVVSIEGLGVWHYDDDWSHLIPETAEVLAYDNGIVIASFADLGVWMYDNGWNNLTPATARAIAVDDGKIVVSIDDLGVWLYDGEWNNLTPVAAREVALEGNTLVASFDELGVWRYDGEWTNLTPATANILALCDGTMVASFDGLGVWSFDGNWTNLTSATARAIASKDGKIAASIDGFGIWFYDGEWSNIAPITAEILAYENEVLAASFEEHGVWLYE